MIVFLAAVLLNRGPLARVALLDSPPIGDRQELGRIAHSFLTSVKTNVNRTFYRHSV